MIHSISVRVMVAVLAVSLAAPVFAAKWRSIPADSSLEFVVTFEGAESTGKFEIFNAELGFEAERIDTSSLHVVVDVRSATMSSADLDEAISEKTWFDSAAYPQADFNSTMFRQTGKQEFLAQGEVSIKGVVQELDLQLNLSIRGDRLELSGNITLSRIDFGIGTGEWESDSSIAHAVDVRFKLLMQKVD